MTREYLALLRGVNVGGKNKVPMKELVKIFEEAGCKDVLSFIQSGNVMFNAPARLAKTIPERVEFEIEARFGCRTPVVSRNLKELSAVVPGNPFFEAGVDEKMLFVMFLADEPTVEAIGRLEPARFVPDEFLLVGKDLYLKIVTGAAKTKMTNQYFDSRLKTVSTSRNWRTVNKLLELMSG